jgi:3-phosphoshikimate 1-carboxyvinyltransferase
VKSAVLLAGLNAPGETVVIEKEPTRDHSERMLLGFGAPSLTVEKTAEGHVITLTGQPELRPQTVAVPRDPSSAAFPVCAALIVEGLGYPVPGVSQNLTRERALPRWSRWAPRHRPPEPARRGRRAGRRPARALQWRR